jgi:transcriptional regulator with PAS, ATPase and Fis domain
MTEKQMKKRNPFSAIVGEQKQIVEIRKIIQKVIDNNSNILIQGEPGTGKNLLAQTIHYNSIRAWNSFLKIDCASIPDELLESELFGHEKGAFTDAHAQKKGKFEIANKGTVFLDGVEEMSPILQAKLLRVIQEREIERLGGTEPIKIDVRIIAASSGNLQQKIKLKRFRDDLYYRLNVVPIYLPPLRDRLEDVPLLAKHFLEKFGEKYNRGSMKISDDVMDLLKKYHWPGNVRELENIIERAIIFCTSENITTADIPDWFTNLKVETLRFAAEKEMTLEDIERLYIELVLKQTHGVKSDAARILGINRKTLLEKRKKFGIQF